LFFRRLGKGNDFSINIKLVNQRKRQKTKNSTEEIEGPFALYAQGWRKHFP